MDACVCVPCAKRAPNDHEVRLCVVRKVRDGCRAERLRVHPPTPPVPCAGRSSCRMAWCACACACACAFAFACACVCTRPCVRVMPCAYLAEGGCGICMYAVDAMPIGMTIYESRRTVRLGSSALQAVFGREACVCALRDRTPTSPRCVVCRAAGHTHTLYRGLGVGLNGSVSYRSGSDTPILVAPHERSYRTTSELRPVLKTRLCLSDYIANAHLRTPRHGPPLSTNIRV